MKYLLLYCRPGFEKECAAEIQDKATALDVYGFARLEKNSGYVLFEGYQENDGDTLVRKLEFSSLIFARQMIAVSALVADMDADDRIGPLLSAGNSLPLCGELRVEMPDTNLGKELSKFCRKFTVPLRQALRKAGKLTDKPHSKKPVAHVFFLTSTSAFIGYSWNGNNSQFAMGIPRLKFPADAPSRSTLKLEEAFHVFIPKNEWEERLAPGMWAVDLGACPGGWTYQLVRRSMFVHAIDNGMMADSLMETGQVKHHQVDGFKFEPQRKNVTWLVCDMVEKPARVAQLMGEWLIDRWAKEAMFNLKLPMNRRYEEVRQDIEHLKTFLIDNGVKFTLQAKHLYHDREEITVHVRRTN
ncbi:Ribosomal RNA large subunit methyltransferase M [Vibrio stylophorae]|uniref:Ribosomal RNA large subunit methyltransferase M n=1 Tax=Vibrio stylophorae TaxID=659351 RepID=A0ABM8ZVB9_9VIBR|nr:23S rRNA (cytidine(2498)-2'-O)-methyltransferase RlmM [Vibrio stylophorae]CAH0534256.1 Ribosomal RNA large subunit methyltransferase M [Vibrio stylophorae]